MRASILVPWAIPTAVSALLWKWIFQADGVANAILGQQILWTTEGFQAKLAVDHRRHLEDRAVHRPARARRAADDPGRGVRGGQGGRRRAPWQQFWRITLPLVKPALLVAVLFRMLDVLRMFDLPFVLVGPHKESVETLSMLAYDEASNLRYGPAAAYATVLFLYVAVVAYAVRQAARRRHHRRRAAAKKPGEPHAAKPAARRPPAGGDGMSADGTEHDASALRSEAQAPASLGAVLGVALIVIYCLAPFYWMVVSAFRRPEDQFDNSLIPAPWSIENFTAVFKPGIGFGRALLNSLSWPARRRS